MEVLKGKQAVLSVLIDGVYRPVFCAISCYFRYDQEEVLKTTINSGKFRERTTRLIDWEFGLTGLTKIDNTDGQAAFFWLIQESVRGTVQNLRLRFVDDGGNEQTISGNCIVKQGQIDSQVGGFSTVSQTFPGTGAFAMGPVEGAAPTDLFKKYLDTTEGANVVSHADLAGLVEIFLVLRESGAHEEVSGTPVDRQFRYDDNVSDGDLVFPVAFPFGPGEIVYVFGRK